MEKLIDLSKPTHSVREKPEIKKVELADYGTFQTLYISANKETIALIMAYVSTLNVNNIQQPQNS